ncbi:hypothetical protein [Corynebacterium aquatimens]|uniref:hypothetical protein n=1 Tax=Corynebacterium aquatimens TaxID=1190508 RepID=UPI003313DF93
MGIDQLRVGEVSGDTHEAQVRVDDTGAARAFTVHLVKHEVDGVVSSCGDAPSTGAAWVVHSVEEL